MLLTPNLVVNKVGVMADLVGQYIFESGGCLLFSIRLIVLLARASLLALAGSVVFLRHYKN